MDESKELKKQAIEEERIHDILLMLDHLVRNEEVAIKFILNNLYDIGSVNLIDQRVRFVPLNGLMRMIAIFSKPIFRIVALRWFKKNGPQLIANWLQRRVSFKAASVPPPPGMPPATPVAATAISTTPMPAIEQVQELQSLRTQVRLLSGISVGAIIALGGMIAWLGYSQRLELLQRPLPQLQMADPPIDQGAARSVAPENCASQEFTQATE